MGIRDLNLWRHGIFKGLGSMFSSPRHSITCIHIGEDGIISKNPLPLDTGFATIDPLRKTWLSIQALKTRMQGIDEQVMVITDRSYIPFNPLRELNKKEREALTPLDNIADVKYNEAFTRVSEENQVNQNHKLLRTVLYLSFFLTSIVVIIVLLKSRGS